MQILAVEDDPVARRVLRQALTKLGHEVVEAEDGEGGLDAMARDNFRVIVSDWIMPNMDGLEFCRRVRERPAEDYVYFIRSYCKKVREDSNYWTQIESYINTRTGTDFSHSVCPDCYQRVVLPELEKLKADAAKQQAG